MGPVFAEESPSGFALYERILDYLINDPEGNKYTLPRSCCAGAWAWTRRTTPRPPLRGIALEGNPLLEFAEVFAGLPVFNSWLSRGPAFQFAHQVRHMPNGDRTLSDSVKEYLKRHHFHHICIGHTHDPHSQPYLTLENLGALASPLEVVISALLRLVPDLVEPRLKTTYFNSGTAGWMEGVVWAIEIDGTGQARLAYWTDKSTGFEYMDWELQPLQAAIRTELDKIENDQIQNAVVEPLVDIEADLDKLLERSNEKEKT